MLHGAGSLLYFRSIEKQEASLPENRDLYIMRWSHNEAIRKDLFI